MEIVEIKDSRKCGSSYGAILWSGDIIGLL